MSRCKMLPYYCRTSVRQQHTWHCPLEFERSTRFIHHAAYLSTASTTCGRFSPRTAWRKDISCLEGTPMHDAANELRRIPLLRTRVNTSAPIVACPARPRLRPLQTRTSTLLPSQSPTRYPTCR